MIQPPNPLSAFLHETIKVPAIIQVLHIARLDVNFICRPVILKVLIVRNIYQSTHKRAKVVPSGRS